MIKKENHLVDPRAWDMARLLVSLPNERVLSSRPEKGEIGPSKTYRTLFQPLGLETSCPSWVHGGRYEEH